MDKLLAGGRVSHLFILVWDLERMTAFYGETLGLELLYYEAGAFAFFCLPGRQDFQIALYPGREEETAAVNHWFIVIDVPDIEGVVGRLKGLGVEVSDIEDVPFQCHQKVTKSIVLAEFRV